MLLEIENLSRIYPAKKRGSQSEVRAVSNVSLAVDEGEFFTLLGPSGCGKTTTLRSIAGLERPDVGKITADGRVLFSSADGINIDASRRGLGMVFQSYAIWPHLNVFANVAFPLRVGPRRRRLSKAAVRQRVDRVLAVVELDHLASRPATDLSGGQQQRLALARALVMEPRLLLLDEPLSNLDAKLREGMRIELLRLQRESGVTAIYVTHDQVEALAMSSRIAVMRSGEVQHLGTPEEIYSNPANRFVADFIGTSNFIAGTVAQVLDGGRYLVDSPHGAVRARSDEPRAVGDDAVVVARPENIVIRTSEAEESIDWRGTVKARSFLGDAVDYIIAVGEQEIRVRSSSAVRLSPGSPVALEFPADGGTLLGKG